METPVRTSLDGFETNITTFALTIHKKVAEQTVLLALVGQYLDPEFNCMEEQDRRKKKLTGTCS